MKIAVNTGGGDAPGLNAVIRGIVLSAHQKGWEVYGIKYGYRGLLDTKQIVRLTPEIVWDITDIGGTILGTAIKGDPFKYAVSQPDGTLLKTISPTLLFQISKLSVLTPLSRSAETEVSGSPRNLSRRACP